MVATDVSRTDSETLAGENTFPNASTARTSTARLSPSRTASVSTPSTRIARFGCKTATVEARRAPLLVATAAVSDWTSDVEVPSRQRAEAWPSPPVMARIGSTCAFVPVTCHVIWIPGTGAPRELRTDTVNSPGSVSPGSPTSGVTVRFTHSADVGTRGWTRSAEPHERKHVASNKGNALRAPVVTLRTCDHAAPNRIPGPNQRVGSSSRGLPTISRRIRGLPQPRPSPGRRGAPRTSED